MSDIVRMRQAAPALAPGAQQGNWMWDGERWVCCQPEGPCGPSGPWFPPPIGQPPWYPGANGGVSFGADPPPNPIRGHFWFDGTALWIFDGAVWVDVGIAGASAAGGGGSSTGANPPSNPADGALWYNTTTGVLSIWDGNAWIPVSQTHVYVQATAPAAPNPGDQWWNGAQMYIWTGSAWAIVGPGATVGPTPTTTETFAITIPTSVTGFGGNWQVVNLSATPQINTQNVWDPIQYKLTPNVAGVYQFTLRAWNGDGGVAIVKNDPGTMSSVAGGSDIVICNAAATNNWSTAMGIARMNGSTDYVRMWGWDGSGTISGAAGNPVFSAWLLP